MRDPLSSSRAIGPGWGLPDLQPRVAPTESELWAHASHPGVIGAGWLAEAACAGRDPELFFPVSPVDTVAVAKARAVCSTCPVRSPCLHAALADPRTAGVWGGTSEAERASLSRRSRAVRTP